MKDKLRQRGFAARVTVDDKDSVSMYLNMEVKRHIDMFYEA